MMNDSRTEEQAVGLCAVCAHSLVIRNDRGSRFYLCQLAATDPRFRKYPPLPVRKCEGFAPAPEDEDGESG
jgi:hypothetical protein